MISILIVENKITLRDLEVFLNSEMFYKNRVPVKNYLSPYILVFKKEGEIIMFEDISFVNSMYKTFNFGEIPENINTLFHSNNDFKHLLAKRKIVEFLIEKMKKNRK